MKILPSLSCALMLCALPAFASVTVTSPKSGSTVSSPVSYAATASTTCSKGVSSMGVYVNNKLIQTEKGAALNLNMRFHRAPTATRWSKSGIFREVYLHQGAHHGPGTAPKSGVPLRLRPRTARWLRR